MVTEPIGRVLTGTLQDIAYDPVPEFGRGRRVALRQFQQTGFVQNLEIVGRQSSKRQFRADEVFGQAEKACLFKGDGLTDGPSVACTGLAGVLDNGKSARIVLEITQYPAHIGAGDQKMINRIGKTGFEARKHRAT